MSVFLDPGKLDGFKLDSARREEKFAPVGPYHIYQGFVNYGYIPDTVLLLAHDVVAHAKEYEEVFDRIELHKTNIIMDNSLVELGKAVDLNMVKEAVKIVGADIAVLPDVMGDGKATLDAVAGAYNEWKWVFGNMSTEVMPLIHGKHIQEWLMVASELKRLYPTTWIGIPRKAEGIQDPHTGKVYSRADLVDMLRLADLQHSKVHLFGFSNSIWEDVRAARYECVKSIDSAVSLRMNASDILWREAGPRGDWWDKVTFDPLMIDTCKQVNKMIGA